MVRTVSAQDMNINGATETSMNPQSDIGLQSFKRVNYFDGQVLSAQDLQDEQSYVRDKQRMLNRTLHGWGVVCGLQVSVRPDAVRVEAGLALDCRGNEIVVPTAVESPLPETDAERFLVVEFVEKPVDHVPVPGGGEQPQATRIEEGFSVRLQSDDPCSAHAGLGRASRWCKEPHPVPLAELSRRGSGWSIRVASAGHKPWWLRLLAALLGHRNCRRLHGISNLCG